MRKLNPKQKKLLIATIALVLVAGMGAGIFFGVRGKAEPVGVYPFQHLGMTEFWGDSQESYGPVTTDKIQTVYLSDTQIVTEVLVKEGDTVKKGDLLITFDTTLSDISVERKRLDVEKLKLQLIDAEWELQRIRGLKPMVLPDNSGSDDEEDSELGDKLTAPYKLSTNSSYDGSSKEKALICWLNTASSIDNTILEAVRAQAEIFQNRNAQKVPSSPSALPEDSVGDSGEPNPEAPSEALPEDPTDAPSEEPTEPEPIVVSSFYVVFKTTQDNMQLGAKHLWQGMHVTKSGGSFRFTFFDAYSVPDHMVILEDGSAEDVTSPEIDLGSGYTAAQIAQMRTEQEKRIKELAFQIKMAEAEYKIMQLEVQDGNVYSTIDGEVVSLLTEEEAKLNQQPILKVSGGGGFYVEGSISELEKDKMQPGQEVTINDWNTGMTYTGKVTSIGNFPSNNSGWNGMGNPNATYYPFTVFVDGSADLQAGSYVSVMYSTSTSENGIYLQNPFVRTEQGRSYVYVLGSNGRLEKRDVVTGKSLWGSYTEILSGITQDDLIAFPYGKNVKDGAPAVESDIASLYDY